MYLCALFSYKARNQWGNVTLVHVGPVTSGLLVPQIKHKFFFMKSHLCKKSILSVK